jgi:hypothetical protein
VAVDEQAEVRGIPQFDRDRSDQQSTQALLRNRAARPSSTAANRSSAHWLSGNGSISGHHAGGSCLTSTPQATCGRLSAELSTSSKPPSVA